MPIQFTCPHCGNSASAADQYAGQTGPCPHCGKPITLPHQSGAVAGPPAKPVSGVSPWVITLMAVGIGAVLFVVCGGVLAGLLLPAVQASREAARRMQCSNNLKQIGLALHNYHDVHDTLPPAYMTDSDGTPTVSWRVLILPYMEQGALYDQIDTQQPWDSPANAALMDAPLPAYSCPSSTDALSANTNYMVVTGPNTLFPNERGLRFREIADGLGNTIAVAEVEGQGVHWASPQDLDIQTLQMAINAEGSGQMGSRHVRGINVLMADGSVRFLSNSTDADLLKSLLTPAGDESVSLP